MLISLMKEEEIPQVAALEQVCFSEPWTEQGLRESFARSEYLFVTATEDDQVVGYAGLYQVLDEGDITNIAVLPSAREKGIGTVLTRALIEAGEQRAIHAFTLEVRVGNAAAIHIYEKLGFKKEGDLIDEFFVNGSYRSAIRMCTFQAPYFEQKAKAARPENFVKPGATIKQYV